jgi:hypothetical protein
MARAELRSLRLSRSDTERLMAALVISLLLHATVWGGYETGKKFGWWQAWHLPAWLHKTAKKNPPPLVTAQPEVQPEIFVDVTQPDAEPPKKTIYYSDKNSHAANPDEDKNSNQPKLNGKQKDAPKTEDVTKFSKLQPSPPQQESPQTQPTEAAQKSSPFNQGDVKLAKLTDHETNQQKAAQQPPRPRTLNEARAQQHLPGQQMQQDGGVHRNRIVPSFDVKATPFGQYDAAMITAIQQYWDDELNHYNYAQDRKGRVTIKFELNYDGTVTDLEISNSDVGILLTTWCQGAIEQTAPFGKWPSDMLHLIGSTQRPVTLTFIY